MSFSSPILFLIFNRPDLQKHVLAKIREVKPKQLFVVADGPRESHPTDRIKCEEARAIIDEMVDWDCEIHKNYSDKNLGCRDRVSSGITWFFEHVEQGIILEDDCLPSSSFFEFMPELLNRYKSDSRIGSISGCNRNIEIIDWKYSYLYSKYVSIWGWATWRRAWMGRTSLENIFFEVKEQGFFRDLFKNENERNERLRQFENTLNGSIDSWGYLWSLYCLLNNYLTVIPMNNTIKNIGFAINATHTRDPNSTMAHFQYKELLPPYQQPDFKLPHPKYESILNDKYRINKSKFKRIIEAIKN